LIAGRGKKFLSCLQRPDRQRSPLSLMLDENEGAFLGDKIPRGVKLTTLNRVPSLGMMEAATSGHHMPSYREE